MSAGECRLGSISSGIDGRPRVTDHALKIPMIVWAAGMAADQITTYRFSVKYRGILRERNPLIRGLDQHPALLVAAGASIDAATAWATYHFIGRQHPRLARLLQVRPFTVCTGRL